MKEETRLPGFLFQCQVPEHLHSGIINYFIYHIRPGGFLVSVLENRPWAEVMARGDYTSRTNLAALYEFLRSSGVPSEAWGSGHAVNNWTRTE